MSSNLEDLVTINRENISQLRQCNDRLLRLQFDLKNSDSDDKEENNKQKQSESASNGLIDDFNADVLSFDQEIERYVIIINKLYDILFLPAI